VPEYLKLRFDEKTRGFNAISFAVMTVFSSGISMYALATLLELLLGWSFHASVVLSAIIVLAYIFMGGLTSAIYNEVLQFFLIVMGFLPLVLLGLKDVGGWAGLTAKLQPVATNAGYEAGAWSSSWRHLETANSNPMGVEWFGMIMGLGFVLSFGYWCTDFSSYNERWPQFDDRGAVRLLAAFPKMLFPALVILPGMIAIALHTTGGGLLPLGADGTPNYNLAVPVMLAHYLPSGLLGLGLTALMASFMSGMAGNVTAFNTVWTYDIYQSYFRPGRSDKHYLRMGHAATVFGILFSVAAAYATTRFNNIMDMLQLVFAFVNAPLFATFLLGMFWRRATGHGAFFGLLIGTAAAALHQGCAATGAPGLKAGSRCGAAHLPERMAQNFWTAISHGPASWRRS
jgi:SSS family solute:Na+ symporter